MQAISLLQQWHPIADLCCLSSRYPMHQCVMLQCVLIQPHRIRLEFLGHLDALFGHLQLFLHQTFAVLLQMRVVDILSARFAVRECDCLHRYQMLHLPEQRTILRSVAHNGNVGNLSVQKANVRQRGGHYWYVVEDQRKTATLHTHKTANSCYFSWIAAITTFQTTHRVLKAQIPNNAPLPVDHTL